MSEDKIAANGVPHEYMMSKDDCALTDRAVLKIKSGEKKPENIETDALEDENRRLTLLSPPRIR